YSIIRVYTLVFGAEAGALAGIAAPWILPAGVLTLVLGAIGVLASRSLLDMICYAVVASMGTVLIAIGLHGEAGLAAALYYIVHSTLSSAALFLIAGLLLKEQGGGPPVLRVPKRSTPLAVLFFVLAVAMVGLPPLAGFIGKILILDAAQAASRTVLVWTAILGTSLLLIIGFARTGIRIFWSEARAGDAAGPRSAPLRPTQVVAVMAGLVLLWSLAAGPVMNDMQATARQLLTPGDYVRAVLQPADAARPEE